MSGSGPRILGAAAMALSLACAIPAYGQGASERLASLEVLERIGRLEGPEEDILGLVQDAVIATDGSIFLIDARLQQVRKYSATGGFIRMVGRAGRGPGEFFWLQAIEGLVDGRVVVIDMGNRRLSIYSPELRLIDEMTLPGYFSDGCELDGRFFIQGVHGGATIHELDLESGDLLRSFGSFPDSLPAGAHPALQGVALRTRGEGYLVCDEVSQSIILAHRETSQVEAYSIDGQLRWVIELPGYHGLDLQLVGGSLIHGREDGNFDRHIFGAFTILPSGSVLVQHALVDAQHRHRDEGRIDSWLVRIDDGQVRRLSGDHVRIVSVGSAKAIAVTELPFPQVLLIPLSALAVLN